MRRNDDTPASISDESIDAVRGKEAPVFWVLRS